MSTLPNYFKYWGKARSEPNSSGAEYHLLAYHSLDVAAVGHVLLQNNPIYLEHFQRLTGLESQQLIRWFTFLLVLHDIGKFADSFQNLNPTIRLQLQTHQSDREYGLRHDSLGWILWKKHLRQQFLEHGLIPKTSGSKRRQVADHPIDLWMAAMVGHHGQPPSLDSSRLIRDDFDEKIDFEASSAFLADLIPAILGKDIAFPACTLESIKSASWWLAGLAVLSDWLGSNTQFFPYQSKKEPIQDYWEKTKLNALKAISATEILSNTPSVELGLADLIGVPAGIKPELTPLQQAVNEWELTGSPQVFILEDVTGAGKTEAAILLAHRLMNAGLGNSLYFALPTMATANTMYERMRPVYRKLFDANTLPSLVLAHGAATMSDSFRKSILPKSGATEDNYGDGTTTAVAHCNAWLADNRKKALLADIGIGTVDQALLAVLPSRHQSLRLLGLVNKVLLVDEVHACDAYMHELLCALLRAHAAAGGSVILLSATLPHKQRQALLNAYAEGRNWHRTTLQAIDNDSYPLMSCLDSLTLRERVMDTRDSVKREVKTVFLHEQQAVETLLAETVASGQCACWIRNTVKDAIETYQRITQAHPDWKVDLFHARYAMGDRIDIEKRVVRRFDKNSIAEQRQGQVLIATQVVEQSLDLDFDTLITDLAPIDLLIQRAGRLRRHSRDRQGNRITGIDQRGEIRLHIFSPETTDKPTANWYAGFFPNAKKVYDHHGQLWLSASLLQRQGKFRMPEDARLLIEGVYGLEAQIDIPVGLQHQSNEAEGSDRADASIARLNALKMDVGYSDASTNRWWDEAKTPTRLGDPTTMVYIAKWQGGELLPWSDAPKHAWHLSAVSIRTYWVAAEAPIPDFSQEAIEKFKVDNLPAKGKWGVLLPLSLDSNNQWCGNALSEKKEIIRFVYSSQFGLLTNPDLLKDAMHESD